jgi:hypothetical protein
VQHTLPQSDVQKAETMRPEGEKRMGGGVKCSDEGAKKEKERKKE